MTAVARRVGVHTWAQQLPQGYDTGTAPAVCPKDVLKVSQWRVRGVPLVSLLFPMCPHRVPIVSPSCPLLFL